MSELMRLCRAEEVEADVPVPAELPGFPPLAVYRAEDRLYVTDNLCTHGQALLTDGYQEGLSIECPFHSGTFNIATGEATRFPCKIALKTYEVAIQEGWVCIAGP